MQEQLLQIQSSCRNGLEELRSYGSPSKYVHKHIGLNARIDPIQAILLFHKLDQYKGPTRKRDIQSRDTTF